VPQQAFKGKRVHGMLKILLITFILLVIAFAGLGIRILIKKHGEFSGGSCQASPAGGNDQGMSCGCHGGSCHTIQESGNS
jgi:hypothetical protein